MASSPRMTYSFLRYNTEILRILRWIVNRTMAWIKLISHLLNFWPSDKLLCIGILLYICPPCCDAHTHQLQSIRPVAYTLSRRFCLDETMFRWRLTDIPKARRVKSEKRLDLRLLSSCTGHPDDRQNLGVLAVHGAGESAEARIVA
jgi:hypothetical protein